MKKALLVAANYPGTPAALAGCANDAGAVAAALAAAGYAPENVLVFADAAAPGLPPAAGPPTRANILRGWAWLLAGAPPGATLFFYFSGHGAQVRDQQAKTLSDEEDGRDEAICPSDFATAGVILDDEIRQGLAARVPVGVTLHAVVDACHSGSGLDLAYELEQKWGRWRLRKVGKYALTRGRVTLLAGCRDAEVSLETRAGGAARGVLTCAYLAALAASPRPPSYAGLLADVRRRVAAASPQVPCLSLGAANPPGRSVLPVAAGVNRDVVSI